MQSTYTNKSTICMFSLLAIVVILGPVGCWMLMHRAHTLNLHYRLSVNMRHLSLSLSEFYETHGLYPPEAPIVCHRGSNEDTNDLWYESLMMIDPDSIRDEVEAYGFSSYYGNFSRLSDPPSRQWTLVYRSTTDSCILVLPGWDGEMEIDMINIDLTDVQTYNGRDWSEFQYDPSNGLKSRGDYIVVGHKGKTIYHP